MLFRIFRELCSKWLEKREKHCYLTFFAERRTKRSKNAEVLTFAGHVLPRQPATHDGVVVVLHPPTAQPHIIETRGVPGLPTKNEK